MKKDLLSPLRSTTMVSTDFITINGSRLEYAWHGPGPDAAPTFVRGLFKK